MRSSGSSFSSLKRPELVVDKSSLSLRVSTIEVTEGSSSVTLVTDSVVSFSGKSVVFTCDSSMTLSVSEAVTIKSYLDSTAVSRTAWDSASLEILNSSVVQISFNCVLFLFFFHLLVKFYISLDIDASYYHNFIVSLYSFSINVKGSKIY